MALDWWAELPPEVQGFLAAVGTDILKNWVRDLASGLLKVIGRRAARPFRKKPMQEALQQALTEALGRALATLPVRPDLADHYRALFEGFLQRQGVQKELSLLLAPRPAAKLDLTLLRREFQAAGYDADRMPGLDFDRFIATLVVAFYEAAAQRPEFQGALEIGLLRGLAGQLQGLTGLARRTAGAAEATAEHTAVLPEIRDMLRERMEGTAPPRRPPGPVRTRIPEPRAVCLIGRADEHDWLCRRLKAGDVAAVAGVRGIGGIGKTELAIAVTRELENHFEGGVIWIDCGPNDAFAIQARVAAAIGIELAGDDLPRRADALAMAFSHQAATLVVLDDVRRRHLADWRFIVLPRPPCALLVTSRRHDLPLPAQAVRRLDVLQPEQSRALLATLLPAAWLDAEPQAVKDIAELLEHVPLALALAARRAERIAARKDVAAQRPLAALLAELRARRARVLNQGDRPDLSVLVTFDASYDDLNPDDQARLCRLGVFARNEFELPAVQAVWQDDEDTARQSLLRLANAGLVEEVEQDIWWVHDLLREYASDRLAQIGSEEEKTARLAHVAFWHRYLETTELLSIGDWHNLAVCRPELEQAADWLLAGWQVDPELASDLAVVISQTFESYVFPRWEAWLEAGLAAAEAAGQRNSARRLQRGLSASYLHRGQVSRARELLHASLSTARALLEVAATEEETEVAKRGRAVTLGDIARLKAQGGDVAGALALHQEELGVYEQLGDVRSRAVTLGDIARLKAQGGDVAGALALHQEMLDIFEQLGDVRSRAVTLGDIARLKAQGGDVAGALALHQEELGVYEQLGDVRSRAVTLGDIARLKAQGGDVAGALALHQERLDIFEQLGDVRSRAVTLGDIARLKAQGGDVAGALALHQERLDIFEQLGDVRSRAVTLGDIARLKAQGGDYVVAERLYRESLDICQQIRDAEGTYALLARLGQLALAQGRREEAVAILKEARQGFDQLGFGPWLAEVDELLARAQGHVLNRDDLLAMIRAARQGDHQAGQQAWEICEGLTEAGDATLTTLGRGLRDILAGIPPETALADLPDDLRARILEVLNGEA